MRAGVRVCACASAQFARSGRGMEGYLLDCGCQGVERVVRYTGAQCVAPAVHGKMCKLRRPCRNTGTGLLGFAFLVLRNYALDFCQEESPSISFKDPECFSDRVAVSMVCRTLGQLAITGVCSSG